MKVYSRIELSSQVPSGVLCEKKKSSQKDMGSQNEIQCLIRHSGNDMTKGYKT